MNSSALEILRRPAVEKISGQPRSTLYLKIKQGLWTTPVRLGMRAVGWPSNECQHLIAARIAGKSDSEIKALVVSLQAARKYV